MKKIIAVFLVVLLILATTALAVGCAETSDANESELSDFERLEQLMNESFDRLHEFLDGLPDMNDDDVDEEELIIELFARLNELEDEIVENFERFEAEHGSDFTHLSDEEEERIEELLDERMLELEERLATLFRD